MERCYTLTVTMYCVSRIQEAKAWSQLKARRDPLYAQGAKLKYPIDPAEPITLTKGQQEIIKPYLPHIQGEAGESKPEDEPETEERQRAAAWQPGEFIDQGDGEEEYQEVHTGPNTC